MGNKQNEKIMGNPNYIEGIKIPLLSHNLSEWIIVCCFFVFIIRRKSVAVFTV